MTGLERMNDFTKEELSILKNGIQYLSDRTSLSEGYLEAHNALEVKIQSMLDNYCEHTPSDAHYEQFRWHLCSKCGVQYK